MKPSSLDDYAEFVAAETPMLLAFARVLTGSSHDAWDLVQDTLLRMRIHWARIDRGGNPTAYARTTMARLNIDRLRRLRRELAYEFTSGLRGPCGASPRSRALAG